MRIFVFLPWAFLLVAATDEVPFEPSSASFADAAACRSELVTRVAGARKAGYAARNNIHYHIVPPASRKLRLQSYADNFK